MASHKELSDDEYVAKLLAEDAKKSSLRYASLGLSALLPKRPTSSAPKPNTRFLKSIIQETDNHNAALKKKEELEARIRLRRLQEEEISGRGSREYDDRKGAKRRRLSNDQDSERRSQRRRRDDGRLRNSSSERSRSRERRHHKSSRRRRDSLGSGEESERYRRTRSDRRRPRARSRSKQSAHRRSSSPEGRSASPRRRRRRSRSASDSGHPGLATSKADREDRTRRPYRRDHRSPQRNRRDRIPRISGVRSTHREEAVNSKESTSRRSSRSTSSDPLEQLVGPIPIDKLQSNNQATVRIRGRGAYRSSGAAMDSHFSANYDPKLDLNPESEPEDEKEDWDMALEALRDREMWKQKHAERLREAGFGDEDIKKWEDSGKEKDVKDVKWSRKGEAREWDAGKVAQDETENDDKLRGVDKFGEGWKRKGGGFLKNFKEALR